MHHSLSKKQIIILVIIIAFSLNVLSFCFAYPEISKPESANLARDFSAYYTGAYRLLHNPTQIYFDGVQSGDYPILPQPQPFKYMPSSLILFLPLLSLGYINALTVFDYLQLALIPLLAFFAYKLVKDKKTILGSIVAAIILIQPLPTPSVNVPPAPLIHLWIFSLNSQSFAPSYYCGYVFVNAHILQTVFLIGALYFGYAKRPWLSALLFTFGLLDPRAALVALPLLVWYNKQKITQFVKATMILVLATNLPFFFYHDIGSIFLHTEMNVNIISQSYAYDWIPIYAVLALTISEIIAIKLKKQKEVP